MREVGGHLHALATSAKQLLQKTSLGCTLALTGVLGLTVPTSVWASGQDPKGANAQSSPPKEEIRAGDGWSKVYKRAVESTVYIFSRSSLCAGALVEKELVLTAWHCVAAMRPVTVGFRNSKIPEQHNVTLLASDSRADLAVLRLNQPVELQPLKLVGSPEQVNEGQAIATIGHPQGIDVGQSTGLSPSLSFVFTLGMVSRVSERYLMSDIPADSGNSGGPILNHEGEIVGVASAKSPSLLRSPNTKSVLEIVRRAREIQRSEPNIKLRAADGTPSGGIFYGHDQLVRRLSGNKDAVWGIHIAYDAFDRIRLGYRHSFFRPERLRAFEAGWTFHFDLNNIVALRPTLLGGWQSYSMNGNDADSGWKLGAEADLASFISVRFETIFLKSGPSYAMYLQI